MTASGLTLSQPRASGGKTNGSSSQDADTMCLPRGVRDHSENTHTHTHAHGPRDSTSVPQLQLYEMVTEGAPLCRYFQG